MDEPAIDKQYGCSDLGAKLLADLQRAGKNIEALKVKDLAPFEEIHLRGREATLELARLAGIQPEMQVLDIGSGIGGPARTLAAEYGCRVTGIDLNRSFVEAAQLLTERVHLQHKLQFRHGNALYIPFDPESFDAAWMQHCNMNIREKGRLFRKTWRVLRPGGHLALYEILEGEAAPPYFPVPWANDPSVSFLISPADLHTLLLAIGFQELVWRDDSPTCLDWHQARLAAVKSGEPAPVGMDLLLGTDFPEKSRNVRRNLEENRIVVIQAVFARP